MSILAHIFTTGPQPTNPANKLDSYIREDTKAALNERYSLEHVALDDGTSGATDPSNPNTQGRHIPGKVGTMGYGTNAQMNALTGMGNGAIFLTTDSPSQFWFFMQGFGWRIIPISYSGVIATDAEAVAGVVTDKAINPAQIKSVIAANVDLVFIPTTNYKDQTITQTINFTDFTAATTITPSKIKTIYISTQLYCQSGTISVTINDVVTQIASVGGYNQGGPNQSASFVAIPILPNQTSITITYAIIADYGCKYSIVGIQQV